jgi:hypothetical protein
MTDKSKHVMIDLETMGITPQEAIVSIGDVVFNPYEAKDIINPNWRRQYMKIKSVGVKWSNQTRQEVQDFLDWCVERGAEPCEGCAGVRSSYEYNNYNENHYIDYFGVDRDGDAYLSNNSVSYSTIVDTIKEAKDLIKKSLLIANYTPDIGADITGKSTDNSGVTLTK